MKKILTTSTILLLCLSTSVVFAGGKIDKKTYHLSPELSSDVILENVELTVDEKNSASSIWIKGKAKAGNGAIGYRLLIDRAKRTYKTEKLSKQELDDELKRVDEKSQNVSNKDIDSLNGGIKALAANYYTGWFKITTLDPVRVPVNATKLTLKWKEYEDGTLEDTSHSISPWAANPSKFDTHWFVDDYDDSTPDANTDSSEITYTGWADYYNDDFGDDEWRTYVSHSIKMTALQKDVGCAGCFDYSYKTDESGESSSLLNYTITTSY
ncbi:MULTISPECIES: hypothetical protein [Brevibacillus]|uniref:hypothetical protein n=1 Tax=Brevibacillus TaxID=55080 RepID=UPI000ED27270|nr:MULTISPECIES: hypothetical protein [unclassified Brevibacillus]MDH6350351.1 hypothetical protein [Brevibacillus sp. 1238]HBZ81293.1 hypothetical protein [Brevibacillus sp.]